MERACDASRTNVYAFPRSPPGSPRQPARAVLSWRLLTTRASDHCHDLTGLGFRLKFRLYFHRFDGGFGLGFYLGLFRFDAEGLSAVHP